MQNYGTVDITNVSATLSTTSELVSISSSTVNYGGINIGESSYSDNFIITISPAAVQSEDLDLRLLITDNLSNEWEAEVNIDVIGSLLLIDENGYVESGQSSSLDIALVNMGQQAESNIYAELSYCLLYTSDAADE